MSNSPAVDAAVLSLADSAKLDLRDAKTIIYWRLATRYSSQLNFFPALALVGPAGSGKGTIMAALKVMPGESSPITDCEIITMAACRDMLGANKDKLFFADECDGLKPEVSHLFMARCNREMADITFKESVGPAGSSKFEQRTVNIFGPTVLHLRNQLDDPAKSSRSIQIFTRHADGPYPDFFADLSALFMLEFDMGHVRTTGGRVVVTWAPVLAVAEQLGDDEYLTDIQALIDMEMRSLREKAEFDPASVVLARIVDYLVNRPKEYQWDRIDIDAYIGRHLRLDYPNLEAPQVNNIITSLGFQTERRGGRRWLWPDAPSLQVAAWKRHYVDVELEELIASALSSTKG